MENKSLISRLAEVYKKQQYTYFVTDGQGNTMAEGLDELTARMYAMKDEGYSIGRDEEHVRVIDDDDTSISYENKDVLSEEDLNEV
tara:strand:- start:344 stop:601 length:258 start_codon:yes stop_codon:yes gene_type:complete